MEKKCKTCGIITICFSLVITNLGPVFNDNMTAQMGITLAKNMTKDLVVTNNCCIFV